MKRARAKNTSKNVKKEPVRKYSYDDIDVPEMISKQQTKKTGTTVHKSAKKKKNKKNNRKRNFLLVIFLILAAFLILMGNNFGTSGSEGALIPVDMEKGKLNILLLGVDEDGLRTDAIMLVSYDLKNPGAKVLSIPRDTKIKVKDRGVTRKINEIHAMHDSEGKLVGVNGSIRAVTALTSVPIHYYIELNFDAIDELADIIGPIEFDVPDIEGNGKGMNYDDPTQDLHIHLKPGLQKLSGNEIQQFLRYRKSNNENGDGSDTTRVKRQQEFLKAAIDQKVNLSLIAKVPQIYSKLKKNMTTNFSAKDAVNYAKYLKGLSGEAITSFSLPGESKRSGAWYFVCDFDETQELIRQEFGYEAENLTNVINIKDINATGKVLKSDKKEDSKAEDTSTKDEQETTVQNEPEEVITNEEEIEEEPQAPPEPEQPAEDEPEAENEPEAEIIPEQTPPDTEEENPEGDDVITLE